MKNISEHISYKEGVYSITALRLGLNNDPTKTHLTNMELLAEKVFEPLRKHVNGPIKINSFYRGPELNKAIGGSANSQHCKGQAIDIDDVYGYMSNADMYEFIKNNLSFDQMIWEFGNSDNPNSDHYTDQMELYSKFKTKKMTFDKQEIYDKAKSIYNPD